MAETAGVLNWSDAQWQTVSNAVTDEFAKANVASQFLPCYGPLAGSVETVRKEELSYASGRVTVSDDETIKLFNVRARVELSSQQVADDSLSSALIAFRRAASLIARVADHVAFNGYTASAAATASTLTTSFNPDDFLASKPTSFTGLVDAGGAPAQKSGTAGTPQALVQRVADSITTLESQLHFGPFACVLGNKLFEIAHTADTGSMVLPADRINPLLDGPLFRSSVLKPRIGVVVSLAPGGIDVVVATPPKVQFLQLTDDAKYVFRVYVRSVMRIKEPGNPGVVAFTL
jgi:uncharacterized linocin/CFP29 family protein